MIEVLVALIILLVGLLGLAGLMIQSQRSEFESYQRVQALILLQDMVHRINVNRNVASCYAFTTDLVNGNPYLGVADGGGLAPLPPCTAGTATQQAQFQSDINDWNTLLQGASETTGGNNAGAMIGARGCISYNGAAVPAAGGPLLDSNGVQLAGTGVYTVEVAWQGTSDTFALVGLSCGKNRYGAETRRRDVSLTFRIGSINNTLP